MASINKEIDAAVVLMKERAAEFDETKTMEGVGAYELLDRAMSNLARAVTDFDARSPIGPRYERQQIADTMNLCALALSALP